MEYDWAVLGQKLGASFEKHLVEAIVAAVLAVLVVLRKRALEWVGRWTPQAAALAEAEAELRKLRASRDDVAALEARNGDLARQLAVAAEFGKGVLSEYHDIEGRLEDLRQIMNAESASIYLPVYPTEEDIRHRSNVVGLSFLVALPVTPVTQELKTDLVPLNSEAGYCFRTGEPQCMTRTGDQDRHYGGADRRTGHTTRDMITLPVRTGTSSVAVLQLINSRSTDGFTADDIAAAKNQSAELRDAILEFASDTEKARAMGIYRTPTETVSIIYADLSNSSMLFRGDRGTAHSVRALNRFLDTICEAAIGFGATIDNYVGDGVVVRFNQPAPLPDHQKKAVLAADAMIKAFDNFKSEPGHREFANNYLRCGVATGPAILGPIGHPQNQIWRLMGTPIAVAANICHAAPRTENIVLVDDSIYRAAVGGLDGLEFEAVDPEQLSSKAGVLSAAVYRVVPTRPASAKAS